MQVDANHGLQRKREPAVFTFWVVRGDQLDQRGPGHNAVHLVQELALAGLFNAQVQIKAALFHGICFQVWLTHCSHIDWDYAEFP